ncbi:tRNA (adenine-N1)-methyltransferase [Nanoarchaeota archaeon]
MKKETKKKITRILMTKEGKQVYVRDMTKDMHTQFGYVKAAELKKKEGTQVVTNTGKKITLLKPGFIDLYKKIKRGAQIIPRKDMGLVIAETGINGKSKVVDAGAGSGACCCMIANLVKEVTTYELREDFHNIVKQNIDFLGLKNVKLKNQDIYEGIDEKNVDLVMLDLPEPWLVVKHAAKALKAGGFLVSYSPTIPQVSDFVKEIEASDNFIFLRSIEIIQREWEVDGRKIRPATRQGIGHSGFMTFTRKI